MRPIRSSLPRLWRSTGQDHYKLHRPRRRHMRGTSNRPADGRHPSTGPITLPGSTPQDHLPLSVAQYIVRGGLKQPVDQYLAATRSAWDRVAFAKPSRATRSNVLMSWQAKGEPALDFIMHAVRGGGGTPAPRPRISAPLSKAGARASGARHPRCSSARNRS